VLHKFSLIVAYNNNHTQLIAVYTMCGYHFNCRILLFYTDMDFAMITFDRLWVTMKQRDITQYKLIHVYHVSPGQITRLKRNQNVSTHTIDMLCEILNCSVEDIMEYKKCNK